jgi:hypothetical protein
MALVAVVFALCQGRARRKRKNGEGDTKQFEHVHGGFLRILFDTVASLTPIAVLCSCASLASAVRRALGGSAQCGGATTNHRKSRSIFSQNQGNSAGFPETFSKKPERSI